MGVTFLLFEQGRKGREGKEREGELEFEFDEGTMEKIEGLTSSHS